MARRRLKPGVEHQMPITLELPTVQNTFQVIVPANTAIVAMCDHGLELCVRKGGRVGVKIWTRKAPTRPRKNDEQAE